MLVVSSSDIPVSKFIFNWRNFHIQARTEIWNLNVHVVLFLTYLDLSIFSQPFSDVISNFEFSLSDISSFFSPYPRPNVRSTCFMSNDADFIRYHFEQRQILSKWKCQLGILSSFWKFVWMWNWNFVFPIEKLSSYTSGISAQHFSC